MKIYLQKRENRITAWRRHLTSDEGGVTFMEVMATMAMMAAALVVTFYSLFISNHALDLSMRREQALRIVQQEVEYWVGRMYVSVPGDPTPEDLQGKIHYKKVPLDYGSPNQVDIWLSRDPIIARTDVAQPGDEGQVYWVITVYAEWTEPNGQEFNQNSERAVTLTTYVSQPG